MHTRVHIKERIRKLDTPDWCRNFLVRVVSFLVFGLEMNTEDICQNLFPYAYSGYYPFPPLSISFQEVANDAISGTSTWRLGTRGNVIFLHVLSTDYPSWVCRQTLLISSSYELQLYPSALFKCCVRISLKI